MLRTGVQLMPEDIIAHCAQRMARHMVPKEAVIVASLPMNPHGKIMKTELGKLSV